MNKLREIKSFTNFREDLQQQNPRVIAVQPDRRLRKGASAASMSGEYGVFGDFQHGLLYAVTTAKRTRNHIEPIFSAYQTEYGTEDTLSREKRAIQLLLAGEVRVTLLQEALPQADVYLAGAYPLEPVTGHDIQFLHERAQELNVTVPNLAP